MTDKEFNELHIGRSPLTGEIYIGTAEVKDNGEDTWKRKKNITKEFESVLLQYLAKLEEFSFQSDGKIYKCTIRECK